MKLSFTHKFLNENRFSFFMELESPKDFVYEDNKVTFKEEHSVKEGILVEMYDSYFLFLIDTELVKKNSLTFRNMTTDVDVDVDYFYEKVNSQDELSVLSKLLKTLTGELPKFDSDLEINIFLYLYEKYDMKHLCFSTSLTRTELNEKFSTYPINIVNELFFGVERIFGTSFRTISLNKQEEIECCQCKDRGKIQTPNTPFKIKQVAGSICYLMFLDSQGNVYPLKLGDTSYDVSNLPPIEQISAGRVHGLFLDKEGKIHTRGWNPSSNNHGQCDIPEDLHSIVQISAGCFHNVALNSYGQVRCWGRNNLGQCTIPEDLPPIKQISAGVAHTAALGRDKKVYCWGNNYSGISDVPDSVHDIKQIASGGFHMVALDEKGKVHCWGANEKKQCETPKNLPWIKQVSAGTLYSVALDEQGNVYRWGRY